MGNLTGVAGGGSFKEQIKQAGASTTTNTEPATGTPVLYPAAVTATFNTGGIDRQGANVAAAWLQVGALNSAGCYTVKVQHSNDDGATDAYADLAASTQGPTGYAVATGAGAVGATANTDYYLHTDLRQAKKWIRYTWTLSSGTGATVAQAVALAAYDTLPPTDY